MHSSRALNILDKSFFSTVFSILLRKTFILFIFHWKIYKFCQEPLGSDAAVICFNQALYTYIHTVHKIEKRVPHLSHHLNIGNSCTESTIRHEFISILIIYEKHMLRGEMDFLLKRCNTFKMLYNNNHL